MARVHFAPSYAVKYVGKKSKEFSHSLARPKPTLKQGDIVVVDKRTAFTLVKKGFGDFESIEDISFTQKDLHAQELIEKLKEQLEDSSVENHTLFQEKVELIKELTELKNKV